MRQQTSIDALNSLEDHIPRIEGRVLDAIREQPMTCWEVECLTRLSHQTVSSRITALREKRKIIDSGLRRQTASGRKAIVWRLRSEFE